VAGARIYVPLVGGGYSNLRSIELQMKDGKYTAEFYISSPTDELRFDPSIYPCEFECDSLHVALAPTRPRSLQGMVQATRALARLRPAQIAVWVRLGLRVLFKRGPRALWDAAVGAISTQVRAAGAGYPEWVREFSTPSAQDLAGMAHASERFARRPRV